MPSFTLFKAMCLVAAKPAAALTVHVHLQAQIAGHTAALDIAKVAAIELPTGQWPDLIQSLLDNMEAETAKSALRQSTLEALGYICEELGNIEQDVLEQAQVNNILTSVAKGMRKEEPDMSVRRAATVALFNAIIFAQTNFENQTERNYLMQIICEGTVAHDARVREASFECLVKIAANYYEKLPGYMQQIFTLTHHAALQDEEDVAKQAIEFWCTVCEEEIDIQQVCYIAAWQCRLQCIAKLHLRTQLARHLSHEDWRQKFLQHAFAIPFWAEPSLFLP